MENVKAMLIPNSRVIGSVEEFTEGQGEMNEPMVLFMDKETNEHVGHFWIEAESLKELMLMFKKKVFFTSSIPEGASEKRFGATFLGFPKDYYKEKDAQLQLNATLQN